MGGREVQRQTINDLLAESRSKLCRLTAEQLHELIKDKPDNSPLILDTHRLRDGVIPGSIHVPRTVLEWRYDPSSGFANPMITSGGFDQILVIFCNHGYSSSLAAANLQRIGCANATDLVGGVKAWISGNFPLIAGEVAYRTPSDRLDGMGPKEY